MTWADVRANWLPLGRQLRHRWSRLSQQDLVAIAGQRSRLIALLQARYSFDEGEAALQADAFVRSLQVLSL